MANKNLLICAAIAAGLLLTACVKKETPKEEEQDKVETAVSEPQPQKPAKFESLESVDTQEAQVQEQPQVEVHREETANTTTEIRRETRPARSDESSQTQVAEQPKSETPKVEPKPEKKPEPKAEPKPEKAQSKPAAKATEPANTEDDAVAAAIAAATPALKN
ncbi:internalin [Acinetobacter baumannii]|uniref:internalin n=1 Tax=Acinetobacter baumannii TaxID=470 RepID=UPI001CF548F9|nr:internalin [Acinetobacter baumannii]MCB2304803.1 internalin [Acinetobacter baumannii]MCT9354240.1 internalin [Acinetobacter baumannii]UMN44669.1 internalin [Acinetobacter baumannii]HCW6292762.1 internalin [Acinetobacter baumannii]